MKTVGLTLSGGAIRGVIHLGVIKAMEEYGINPEIVTGTSMGSIIGGLYSVGYSYDEILEVISTITPDIWDFDWKGIAANVFKRRLPDGLIKGNKIEALIDEMTGGIYVEDVKLRKIGIVATNLNGGQNVIFTNHSKYRCNSEMECIRSIKLSKAIRASLSLPFLFKPVIFGDYVLVDGGVVNNCPVNIAQKLGADLIVASDIDYNGCKIGTDLDGVSILFATLDVIVKEACDDDFSNLRVPVLRLEFGDVPNVSLFNFTKDDILGMFEIGYKRTLLALTKIEKDLA